MASRAETLARLAQDRERLRGYMATDPRMASGWLWANPSYQAVWLHRWSRYFFCRGNRWLARLLWHLNLMLTGADLSPISDVKGGFLMVSPLCVVWVGSAGRNLTLLGQGGCGGGLSRADIGAGPGLPVFGDDVVLGVGAMVLGAVRIGNGARLGARCAVTDDIPDGAEVLPPKSRVRRRSGEGDESVKDGASEN